MSMQIRGNTQILAGTIEDDQIAANAAIATTKLAEGEDFFKKDGTVTATAYFNMGGFAVTNAADPSDDQDLATKFYVDTVAQGLIVKDAVRAATTDPFAATYANNVLTATDNGAISIDGVSLSVGQRVLVKNQASALQNGIYEVTTVGSAEVPFELTRSQDVNGDPASEVKGGIFTFVQEGSTNADSGWVVVSDGTITVGTSAINWSQFSGAGQISAGSGLSKTGNQLDVNTSSVGGLEILSDELAIKLASNSALSLSSSGLTVDSSIAGNGLSLTAGILDISLSTTGGLQIGSDEVSIKLASNSALALSSSGLTVDSSIAGNGLGWADGVMAINTASAGGLEITTDELAIKLATNSALSLSSSGLTVDSSIAGDALTLVNGVLAVAVTTDGGIQISTDALALKLATNSALSLSSSGLTVDSSIAGTGLTWTNGVLSVDGSTLAGDSLSYANGVLDVNVSSTGGLQVSTDALAIKLATNSALSLSSSGLTVDSSIAGSGLVWTDGVLSVSGFTSSTLNSGWIYRGNGSNVATAYRDVHNEVPSTTDYTSYQLTYSIVSGTESVYINGILQREGGANDYTISNGEVVFTSANQTTDIVLVSYLSTN